MKKNSLFITIAVLAAFFNVQHMTGSVYRAIVEQLIQDANEDKINPFLLSEDLKARYVTYIEAVLSENPSIVTKPFNDLKGKMYVKWLTQTTPSIKDSETTYYPWGRHGTHLTVVQGDIVKQPVDAIVNAANEQLNHGSGVALAIDTAAGIGPNGRFNLDQYRIDHFSRHASHYQKYAYLKLSFLEAEVYLDMGEALITPAFDLEDVGIKWIIHTVGPRGAIPEKQGLLRDAYQNSLGLAKRFTMDKKGSIRTIAFPAISTAIFGYDSKEANPVAIKAVIDYVNENRGVFDEIRFVFREKGAYDRFNLAVREALKQ